VTEADPLLGWLWFLFPVLLLGFWIGLLQLFSRWGGWRSLATHYRSSQPLGGEVFRFRSARMRGGLSYNSCLVIGVDVRGLHLAVLLPLRPAHPTLFIPWEDVRSEPGRSWGIPVVTYRFVRAPGIPLTISRRLSRRLSRVRGERGEEAAWH
jgi:hypothetical protein